MGWDSPKKATGPYTFEEFGSDVRHLIKSLALKDVTLVGRSMGVSVSLSYLEQFQDDGDVSRVVLVTGPIKLTNSADWELGNRGRGVHELYQRRRGRSLERTMAVRRGVVCTTQPRRKCKAATKPHFKLLSTSR